MRLALHVLLYLLAVSTSPGLVELIDDGAHLVLEGHTEHGDEDGEGCDEHGCTPASHHCACCTSIAMALSSNAAVVHGAERTSRGWTVEAPVAGPRGVRDLLERPPAA